MTLSTLQIVALSTAGLNALSTGQFKVLSAGQIAALSTQQAVALETVDFASLATAQIVALSTADVEALNTAQIVALTSAQAGALSTAQVAAMDTQSIASLESADLAVLGVTQMAALGASQVKALLGSQTAALTTGQVMTLSTLQIVALSTAQLAAMTTEQARALTTLQVTALGTTQIMALAPRDFASISTSAVIALRTSQVVAMTTAQALALTSVQLASFAISQVAAFSTADLVVMTTEQFGVLPCGLTDTQKTSLATAQIAAYIATPIMLDLNGDGVQTLGLSAGVRFDVRANGLPMQTGWVSKQDGLLVMDRNGDGSINDGSELFGSSTLLPDGTRAQDGYQALTALDKNSDGVINCQDDIFGQLRVWVDANSDGLSAPDELRTLDSWGIASISTQAIASSTLNNGNLMGLVSSYQTTDGQIRQAVDVWFGASMNEVLSIAERVNYLTQALGEFAQVQAAPSIQEAVVSSPTQPAASSMLAVNQSLVAALQSYQSQAQPQPSMTCANAAINTPANLTAMAAPIENSTRLSGVAMSLSDPKKLYQLADSR